MSRLHGLTDQDIQKIKRLIRESQPPKSSKPATRRTRRVRGQVPSEGGKDGVTDVGMAIVIEDVQGKTEIANIVQLGTGKAQRFLESETTMGKFEVIVAPFSDTGAIHEKDGVSESLKFQMFNSTPNTVKAGSIIQWKKIGRLWPELGNEPIAVIDAQDCG